MELITGELAEITFGDAIFYFAYPSEKQIVDFIEADKLQARFDLILSLLEKIENLTINGDPADVSEFIRRARSKDASERIPGKIVTKIINAATAEVFDVEGKKDQE